jgi:hypothetical protein
MLMAEGIELDFKNKYTGSFYRAIKLILNVNLSLQYIQKL